MEAGRVAAQQDLWDLFRLTSEHGPDPLTSYLERVCEFCSRWFRADGVSLFLRENGSDDFCLRAQSGLDRRIPLHASFKLGEGFAGLAASDGNPILLKDGDPLAKTDKRTARTVVGSAIVLPLVTPLGECVGVFNLSRRIAGSKFKSADVQKAVAVSQHLALAISNATLVSKLHALASTNENIVQSLQATVVSMDRRGRIVGANSQALKFLGRSDELTRGSLWSELFSTFSRESYVEIAKCVKSALAGRVRRARVSEKPDRHYQICASPAADGQVTLVIEDISNSVWQDRELERSMRLAELGQLAAAVAHEIRNPLTSIKGAAQMLASESDLSEAQKWGHVIAEEADALNALCADFLDLAKPIGINRKPTDLVQVLGAFLERMKSEIKGSNWKIHFTHAQNIPIIQMDAPRVIQAVRNLIRNALEAMPKGGEVTVGLCRSRKSIEISVSDEGVGMSEEQLSRLFTPFFTTKSKGTGLGLCNIRKIVEAHQGTISVESTPGEGTTFTIRMPVGKRL